MKICPTCGRGYDDDLSFCLQDGTRLPGGTTSDLSNKPTEVYPRVTFQKTDISAAETIVANAPPTRPTSPQQYQLSVADPRGGTGCVVTLGKVAAGLIVVAGIGLIGFYNFLAPYSSSVAVSNKADPVTSGPPLSYPTGTGSHGNANYPVSTADGGKPSNTTSGGVLNSKAISLPKPAYPPAARSVRASGTVNVNVVVDEKGNVISATAVSGHPLLRAAAAQAARSAKFEPALVQGKPVKVSGVLTYDFSL